MGGPVYPGPTLASKIKRISKKFGVLPIFKSSNTIRDNIVNLKDKVCKHDKKNVVYKIPLACGKVYVGETGRNFGTRLTEHNNSILERKVRSSALFEHLTQCQQMCGVQRPRVKWGMASILCQESHNGKRLARESLEIKMLGGTTVNRNSGQPEVNQDWMKVVKVMTGKKKHERGRPGQSRRRGRMRIMGENFG